MGSSMGVLAFAMRLVSVAGPSCAGVGWSGLLGAVVPTSVVCVSSCAVPVVSLLAGAAWGVALGGRCAFGALLGAPRRARGPGLVRGCLSGLLCVCWGRASRALGVYGGVLPASRWGLGPSFVVLGASRGVSVAWWCVCGRGCVSETNAESPRHHSEIVAES